MIRDYIELLDIVYQNPETDVKALFESQSFEFSAPDSPGGEASPEFGDFRL